MLVVVRRIVPAKFYRPCSFVLRTLWSATLCQQSFIGRVGTTRAALCSSFFSLFKAPKKIFQIQQGLYKQWCFSSKIARTAK